MIYLLDTNVCIAAMRGKAQVVDRLTALRPDDIGVSMVSVFELFAGVARCNEPESEGLKVSNFLAEFHLLSYDWDSALRSARVRWELEKAGNRIGPYDLQIAGQALALDLICVTHNTKEFSRVSGLRFEDWESV